MRLVSAADFYASSVRSRFAGGAKAISALSPDVIMRPVDSSSLRRVGYCGADRTLRIEFKAGRVWDYLQVPLSEYEALMQADSLGRYFSSHIRNCFQSREVL